MIRDYDNSDPLEKKVMENNEGMKTRIQPIVLTSDYWPDNEDVEA